MHACAISTLIAWPAMNGDKLVPCYRLNSGRSRGGNQTKMESDKRLFFNSGTNAVVYDNRSHHGC